MLRGVVYAARQALPVGVGRGRGGAALAVEFVGAAQRYWLKVFPRVCGEVGRWRTRACAIPDPVLRRSALGNLRAERSNLDGAAAFAAFAPTPHRRAVVRAQVAFQVIYDYVDTLAEQPCSNPVRNGDRLHRALLAALDPARERIDYYVHHARRDDASYLHALVDACQAVISVLPAFSSVAACLRRAAVRIAAYQSLNLCGGSGGHAGLECWAREALPGSDLRWWEVAASAGSSLEVFVLIAAAAERAVRVEDAVAIEAAYFPWIGSLHTLLDSLVDRREDDVAGHYSLLDYYGSSRQAATRMARLAAESRRRAALLPRGSHHSLVLAGMASHYLSMPDASRRDALLTARAVLAAIGELAAPAMVVMGARRMLDRDAHATSNWTQ
jgi:tetraprenyl-beta-curcumene synthase